MREWEALRQRYAQKPIELGLERVVKVWRALGEERPPFVFAVAGTNGKGSCSSLLDGILRGAGYRVGLYTSPHLISFRERIRLHGKLVSEDALDEGFGRVAACPGAGALTQFELDTLAAVHLMSRVGVDAAVLEVGLGGRLDAVNIFDADCALLTSVGLDHTEYLGTDREQIAREKAGIFRRGRPAVCGEPDPPPGVAAHAGEVGAELRQIGHDFGYEAVDGAQWRFWSGGQSLLLPYPALRGRYQLGNASTCLAALEAARGRFAVSEEAVRQGLAQTLVPGRFQIVPGEPMVVLDVGHNPHAASALAENLRGLPCAGRTLAVFAALADKDIAGMVAALAGAIDAWYLADIHQPRGAKAAQLAAAVADVAPGAPARLCADAKAAFQQARSDAGAGDRIVVFGSFFTVADALRVLEWTVE